MANLSSLIHELRERIAAASSSPSASSSSSSSSEDPLEARFRGVLPTLLSTYVNPSSPSNEREVTAVLKLLSHTARNFPGVFYNGKASAVLPIIGRVIPFLAEPTFHSRHGIIFETIASVLSLLRIGEREVYRQFFLDAMDVVEGTICITTRRINKTSKWLTYSRMVSGSSVGNDFLKMIEDIEKLTILGFILDLEQSMF